jgi:hypothetical protein
VYEWLLLYWMPYDNNLSGWEETILGMLARGASGRRTLVAVQSDSASREGLLRSVMVGGTVTREEIGEKDSSSPAGLDAFLQWARSQYQAERWAIIFLGHGGRLDSISPDLDSRQPRWMNIRDISRSLTRFDRAIDGRLELLFLQNCFKGTIEVLFEFRNAARYTLSSQSLVGVPNYYYEPLLQSLSGTRAGDGAALAELIMGFEPPDMFEAYSLTDNSAFARVPPAMNRMIESMARIDAEPTVLEVADIMPYGEDLFVDLVGLVQRLAESSRVDPDAAEALLRLIQGSLIGGIRTNNERNASRFRGINVWVPRGSSQIEAYPDLNIWSHIKLREFSGWLKLPQSSNREHA